MNQKEIQKKLDKSACAFFKMGTVPHKRPPKPKKAEMGRKFKMNIDKRGKPSIQEI